MNQTGKERNSSRLQVLGGGELKKKRREKEGVGRGERRQNSKAARKREARIRVRPCVRRINPSA